QWHATQGAGARLGLRLTGVELREQPYDYERALYQVPPDFRQNIVVMSSPFFFLDRARLADFALRNRVASMLAFREWVDPGGLLSYGPSITGMYERAAEYVDRIATSTIPVVAGMGSDPVALGLAKSLNRPGGNITGATFITTELVGKRLELLCEVVPQAKTVAYLNPSPRQALPSTEQLTSEFLAAARTLGRQVAILQADSDSDFEAIFEALVERHAGVLVIASSLLFDTHDDRLAALALRHSIPAIYQRREFVEAGGLMSYSANWGDAFRAAGLYVGRILKGEKPAELPFQQSSTFELAINLKTAKALGLSIPRSLLDAADEVIE